MSATSIEPGSSKTQVTTKRNLRQWFWRIHDGPGEICIPYSELRSISKHVFQLVFLEKLERCHPHVHDSCHE